MKQTLYDVLEVERDASADDIARAYEAAMEKMNAGGTADPARKVILRDAYQILTHPQRRDVYDASLARPSADEIMSAAVRPRARKRLPLGWMLVAFAVISLFAWWKYKKVKNAAPPPPVVEHVIAPPERTAIPVQPAAAAEVRSAEDLYAQLSPSVARIDVMDARGNHISIGSGVALGGSTMITNCHVVRNGSQFDVRIDHRNYSATVEVSDGEFDLCRLNVAGLSKPEMAIGDVSSLKIGEKVYAIGAPHGLELTISDGIVSSLRDTPLGEVIQTTAPVSPGSSGGGLFDPTGRLVGIVTFQHRYGQNLNFAVPAEWIAKMRTRPAAEGVGNITMPDSPGTPSGSRPAASESSSSASPRDQIVGDWQCFNVVTGWNILITFRNDGRIIWIRNGKTYGGSYNFDGGKLTLRSADSYTGSIDELTQNKMIINGGGGARTVCHRG